ncbi:MAG: PspA/IM30 family protein, partial [Stellaceae bacterium]
TDAFARFEQVERALDEMEGKADVLEIGRKPLADEIAGLEKDADVDEELAALKQRLSNRLRPEPGPA